MVPPDPLTEVELKKIVLNSIVARTFKHSNHLFDRISERNLSIQDVRHICQNGKLIGTNWDMERSQWRYELRCKALDRIETSVVLAITQDQYFVIAITTY